MTRRNFSVIVARFKDYSCAQCGIPFKRYPMNATRAAKPQYCSRKCVGLAARATAKEKLTTRLWERISKGGDDDCWEWHGRRDPNGYGRLDVDRVPQLAHRLVFEVVTGNRPEAVCHSCDNPPCCNPSHLWAGTQSDNAADMIAKGRLKFMPGKKGELNNTSKLQESDVLEIVRSPDSNAVLGRRFGVTKEAIWAIRNGRNWRHITGLSK